MSVSQTCNQGYNSIFNSIGCKVVNVDSQNTIVKEIRTQGNVQVMEGGK
jgi:hypothetical protein